MTLWCSRLRWPASPPRIPASISAHHPTWHLPAVRCTSWLVISTFGILCYVFSSIYQHLNFFTVVIDLITDLCCHVYSKETKYFFFIRIPLLSSCPCESIIDARAILFIIPWILFFFIQQCLGEHPAAMQHGDNGHERPCGQPLAVLSSALVSMLSVALSNYWRCFHILNRPAQ